VSGHYIGIMSGTSVDGIDAALVDFSPPAPNCIATTRVEFPDVLRSELLALSRGCDTELDKAGAASQGLAELYAAAASELLSKSGLPGKCVTAIGCHGQTVRHRPESGITVQLNDPARVAERTGIDVVADFRRRDMAAGGQGAPLVPAFHDAVFRKAGTNRGVVNIGGISNLTVIANGKPAFGFDCGPGNVLLDSWVARHSSARFDDKGAWAGSGRAIPELLARLLDEPYFRRQPPKSTGRELFNDAWLAKRLAGDERPQDVQATLVMLTALAIADAVKSNTAALDSLHVCGGGALNLSLMRAISKLLPETTVAPTDELGVPVGQVEAIAFAWLAMKCIRREPIDLRSTTGASHPCILGAVYPA
jgi:anhydro-N-acetylmuramic acid kinase